MPGEQDIRRLAKEHAAAVQAYLDAGNAVCVTMGRLSATMANEENAPEWYTDLYYKCDAAAGLVDEAFHAVRNALER